MKATTTDATPKKLGSVTVLNSRVGIAIVTVSGYDGTDGITGQKAVRYKKSSSGILTLGTAVDVVAPVVDAGLGSSTFTLTAVGNNIDITVTGAAGKTINWTGNADITPNQNA